jgi:hypothetical protein
MIAMCRIRYKYAIEEFYFVEYNAVHLQRDLRGLSPTPPNNNNNNNPLKVNGRFGGICRRTTRPYIAVDGTQS